MLTEPWFFSRLLALLDLVRLIMVGLGLGRGLGPILWSYGFALAAASFFTRRKREESVRHVNNTPRIMTKQRLLGLCLCDDDTPSRIVWRAPTDATTHTNQAIDLAISGRQMVPSSRLTKPRDRCGSKSGIAKAESSSSSHVVQRGSRSRLVLFQNSCLPAPLLHYHYRPRC